MLDVTPDHHLSYCLIILSYQYCFLCCKVCLQLSSSQNLSYFMHDDRCIIIISLIHLCAIIMNAQEYIRNPHGYMHAHNIIAWLTVYNTMHACLMPGVLNYIPCT